MKNKIILIGGGGHCKSCIDVIECEGKYEIAGILDLNLPVGTKILGYEVLGKDNGFEIFHKKGYSFLVTVGQIKSPVIRKKITHKLTNIKANLPTIISPRAYVSKNATIGSGTIIMHNSFVNSGASIGNNCILNTGCSVEHDATIGSNCHISTNSNINGDSSIGNETFIGSNATISSQIIVGDNVVVGAGSVIIKNVPNGATIVGNPGKIVKL